MDTTGSISNIEEQLLTYESPFRWQPRTHLKGIPDYITDGLLNKINERILENIFSFEDLMCYITLSYEYGIANNIDEALKILEDGENKSNTLINDSHDHKDISGAFLHILMSTKAYLILQKGDLHTVSEIMSKIPKLAEMDVSNQAAIYGLRAVFIGKYGDNGIKLMIDYISKAIEMNPNEPRWLFVKGKYLSRVRRQEHTFTKPSKEEIDLLNRAMNMSKKENGQYCVYIAEVYREVAKAIFIANNRRYNKEIILMNEKSVELYKRSIKLRPNCAAILFRCAKGFIKLPHVVRDYRLAKELLDRALKISPTCNYGNHITAQYYEQVGDIPMAMKYLKNCHKNNLFAAIHLLNLECEFNKEVDVLKRLNDLLDYFSDSKILKCKILSLFVSYHLFVLNDLKKACEYADEVIRLVPKCDYMLHHYRLRERKCRRFMPMNLFKMLAKTIKNHGGSSTKDKEYYDNFLNNLSALGLLTSNESITSTKKTASPKYMYEKSSTMSQLTHDVGSMKIGGYRSCISTGSTHDKVTYSASHSHSNLSTEEQVKQNEVHLLSWRKNSKGPTTVKKEPLK